MADYHKYVFDVKKREFVGAFEEMYQQETKINFDSWHQEDSRQLNRKVALAILDEWNFRTIIDIGAGKGALTHLLKKRNNQVIGLDISSTAVDIARSRFPDIEFDSIDVNNIKKLDAYFENKSKDWGKSIELVFSSECLSYLKNWREFLRTISQHSRFLMISLYIPEDPIGFVKNFDELETEINRNFEIYESVRLTKARFIVIFAKSHAV